MEERRRLRYTACFISLLIGMFILHFQRLRSGLAVDAFAGDLGKGRDRHKILCGGGAAVFRLDGGDRKSGAGLFSAEPNVKGSVSVGCNVSSQLRVVNGAKVDAVVDSGRRGSSSCRP